MTAPRARINVRIPPDLAALVRGVWAAEHRAGNVRLPLRAVVERMLRDGVEAARARGLDVQPLQPTSESE